MIFESNQKLQIAENATTYTILPLIWSLLHFCLRKGNPCFGLGKVEHIIIRVIQQAHLHVH